MKLVHKVNFGWSPPQPAMSGERYDAEIEASVARAERAWRRAQQAAERAERRARVHCEPSSLAALEDARRRVADRWVELTALKRQMEKAPAHVRRSVRAVLPKGGV